MRSVNSPRQRPQILLAADAAGPADRGASLEHLSFFSYTTGAPQTFSDSSKRRFHLSAAEGFAPLAAPTNPQAPLPLRRTLRSQSGASQLQRGPTAVELSCEQCWVCLWGSRIGEEQKPMHNSSGKKHKFCFDSPRHFSTAMRMTVISKTDFRALLETPHW